MRDRLRVPGAIGASLALPGRPAVAVVGDGSAMYSVQALWTAANLELPVTYVIIDNREKGRKGARFNYGGADCAASTRSKSRCLTSRRMPVI